MKKFAFITGATSGIGQATALQLASLDYSLVLCGRRTERLRELAEQLQARTDVHTLAFDVRDRSAVHRHRCLHSLRVKRGGNDREHETGEQRPSGGAGAHRVLEL